MSFRNSFLFSWLILFIVAMSMNFLTPMSVADDGAYAFIKEPVGREFDENRPVDNLSNIVESMTNHWYTHNGRIVNHSLESLFMGIIGKPAFNVFNALVFCFTLGFFLCLCGYDWRSRWLWLLMLLFSALMPAFGETTLWVSGSFNYLWTAFFVLGFLVMVRHYHDNLLSGKHWLLMPVAFICGWTHEIMTLPVSMALGLYMLLHIRKIWGRAVLPLMLGFMMGTAMNVLAPATFVRAEAEDVADVAGGLVGKVKSFVVSLSRLRIAWLLIVLCVVSYFHRKKAFCEFVRSQRWLIVITLFSFLVVWLSGMSNARVRFGIESFSLMLLMGLFHHMGIERYKKSVLSVSIVGVIIFLIPILYYQKVNHDHFQYCKPQLKNKEQLLILTPTDSIPDFWCTYLMKHVDFGEDVYYLAADKDKTMVRYMSAYYGKKGMCYLPEALYKDIVAQPSKYRQFHTLPYTNLYVKEVANEDSMTDVKVRFDLRPAEPADVPLYLRPIAKYISTYSVLSCSPNYSKVLTIQDKQYLVVPAPIKGMAERVIRIVEL